MHWHIGTLTPVYFRIYKRGGIHGEDSGGRELEIRRHLSLMTAGGGADSEGTKHYHNQCHDLHDIIGYKMVLNHGRLHHVVEWMLLVHTNVLFDQQCVRREEDMTEYLYHHSIK